MFDKQSIMTARMKGRQQNLYQRALSVRCDYLDVVTIYVLWLCIVIIYLNVTMYYDYIYIYIVIMCVLILCSLCSRVWVLALNRLISGSVRNGFSSGRGCGRWRERCRGAATLLASLARSSKTCKVYVQLSNLFALTSAVFRSSTDTEKHRFI